MNKDTEDKVMMLLRTIANPDNWLLIEKGEMGSARFYDYMWIKEHYDPLFVAKELLEQIEE